ncbi:hypothetical protein HYX08_06425 [Candidatus Woesearchaeota archaeon]|nr:hypothetical protein [Candidatus Woesearchaeota archaeon]
MDLTKREKRRLRFERPIHEDNAPQEHKQAEQKPKKSKYYAFAAVIGIILIAIIAYSVYSGTRPGPYDSFAKCLTEKGAVMYGAMDWCKYTQGQKAMFGRSFRHIDYHEFDELPGIKTTPTWVINGEWHENVQTFDKLAALTGCRVQG